MKNCDKIQILISAYIDNQCNETESLEVKTHITQCAECKQFYDDIVLMKNVLSDTENILPRPGFETKIEELISRKMNKTSWLGKGWINTLRWVGFGAITTAVLLFVINKFYFRDTIEIERIKDHQITNITKSQSKQKPDIKITKPVKIVDKNKDYSIAVSSKGLLPDVVQQTIPISPKSTATVTTAEVKQVVQVLVEKGMSAPVAKQTVETAMSYGYNPGTINSIVTQPQKNVTIKSAAKLDTKPEFEFVEAAPNPFTPNNDGVYDEVYFKYRASPQAKGELKIYNIRGSLVKKTDVIGDQTLSWDGKNDDGVELEGGIYVYILKLDGNTVRGTVVLAK